MGISEEFWTIIIIIVLIIISILIVISQKDIAFAGVFIWAFIGIALKRINEEGDFFSVGYSAIIGAIIIGLTCIISLFHNKTE